MGELLEVFRFICRGAFVELIKIVKRGFQAASLRPKPNIRQVCTPIDIPDATELFSLLTPVFLIDTNSVDPE
jgi:hypothetical protein